MAVPHTESVPIPDGILKDPGGHYDTPLAVVRDPLLDDDTRRQTLGTWLGHERLLYGADRDAGRVARMRQIEGALARLDARRIEATS